MIPLQERLARALSARYTVERELGHGGTARVYLALDLRLHRPVAIKVLRPDVAAALGVERFLREIEIAARLSHPHILSLLDSDETDGLLYYSMPYFAGASLRDRLVREPQLPLDDALRITRSVAAGLQYAHDHDVVHRDIKPGNILLAGDEVLVADFGIARAITSAGGDMLTSKGITVGTPAYMSPEQGAAQSPVDGRSDVFSLGCVLYEMLAGSTPFPGVTAREIQARKLIGVVPPIRTVRADVPGPVERAVLAALSAEPTDRFASAAQFAGALAGSPASRKASQGSRLDGPRG